MGRPGPRSGSVRGAARQRADEINDRPRQNPAYRPASHSFITHNLDAPRVGNRPGALAGARLRRLRRPHVFGRQARTRNERKHLAGEH